MMADMISIERMTRRMGLWQSVTEESDFSDGVYIYNTKRKFWIFG